MNNNEFTKAKICNTNEAGNISQCSDIALQLPDNVLSSIQSNTIHDSSVISNNPSFGEFNNNIFGAGLGLVLIFYLLGYGLGRMIKMVNL
ncbi:Uncharacterised protein [Proteus mirabilis]|uniref:hypothetical protein n=1 Tax=Proteus mirabilis TaxID=584 RepID=UPI000E078582|nr:hypothetical protein [Proteus mirabilis]SUC18005.1 Uncharacterised protein [Proteus mirabilis]SUC22089.1 Uncharacterised protein [Proteus mirabilis]SUC22102.1 Uncharacterised protein [Proteus mirabilis]HEM6856983.1 hypothetical protein [Providencia rettgeri]